MKLLSHAVSEQDLEQLAVLEGLLSFELGRFMLKNRGLNGFWTEYVCSYPARKARGETAGCGPAEVELLEAIPGYISPSPDVDPDSTWKMGALDPKRLRRQVILFVDVMQAGFMHARSVTKTRKQLEAVGFRHVEFIPDSQGLFPTVIATK